MDCARYKYRDAHQQLYKCTELGNRYLKKTTRTEGRMVRARDPHMLAIDYFIVSVI